MSGTVPAFVRPRRIKKREIFLYKITEEAETAPKTAAAVKTDDALTASCRGWDGIDLSGVLLDGETLYLRRQDGGWYVYTQQK